MQLALLELMPRPTGDAGSSVLQLLKRSQVFHPFAAAEVSRSMSLSWDCITLQKHGSLRADVFGDSDDLR